MVFTGGEPPAVNIGNRAGYIAGLLREGKSANAILRELQAAGGGIQRQAGLRLVAQVRDTLSRAPDAGNFAGNQLPDAGQYGTWAMGRGGQYATQVAVYLQDRDNGDSIKQFYTHVSNEPHTPEDAANAAIDLFSQTDDDSEYDQRVMGAMPGTMWQTVPYK